MKLTIVNVKDLVYATDDKLPKKYLVKHRINYFIAIIIKLDNGNIIAHPYGPQSSSGWLIPIEDISIFALIED